LIGSCASVEVRAVRKGDVEEIRKFLADGGDPNTVDRDGNALIHIAVQYGRAESLDTLLRAGADANMKNRAGNTAAIMAAESDRRDMIDLLIKYGGDMRTRGNGGVSTLMLAASTGNLSLMDILLKLGVPLEGADEKGRTALFYGVSAPGPEALSFLYDRGADGQALDRDNGTPLHLLDKNSQVATATLLLDRGVDINRARHSSGETALHIASGAGAWRLVETYLGRGASLLINQTSTVLGTPLFYALGERINKNDGAVTIQLLLEAGADPDIPSVRNKLPIVQAVEELDARRAGLLLRYGADPDVLLISRKSLLHIAVERKDTEMAELLLDYNVDPDIRDMSGKTPLFYAVEKRDEDMVQYLLANGSNPNINSHDGTNMLHILLRDDAKRASGFSSLGNVMIRYGASLRASKDPLHPLLLQAAVSGNETILRYLLENRVNPNVTEEDGVTALMITSARQYSELSFLLIRYGAVVNTTDNRGNTSLHYAARIGSVAGVELLLRFKAAPDPVNYENKRPIELAPDNAQGEVIVQMLLAAGAAPLPDEPSAVVPAEDSSSTVAESEEDGDIIVIAGPEEVSSEKDDSPGDGDDDDRESFWEKAKVLVLGTDEPRNVSKNRTTFQGYGASVPVSFPRNMYSRFNNRNIKLYIRNETGQTAEIYIVNANGLTEAVSPLASGAAAELGARQGNVYPLYSVSSLYFGDIQATGQSEQYFRLVAR